MDGFELLRSSAHANTVKFEQGRKNAAGEGGVT
jgi:hypothetical protein